MVNALAAAVASDASGVRVVETNATEMVYIGMTQDRVVRADIAQGIQKADVRRGTERKKKNRTI